MIPNPEAPFDDLDSPWQEPPPHEHDWWALLIVALMVVLMGVAVYSFSMLE